MASGREHPVRSRAGAVEGSTFLGVLAVIAVMITLATVVTPGLVGVLEFERVDRAARELAIHERSLTNFHAHVSRRPQTLGQLTRQIVSTDRNSCGGTYTNQQLKNDGSVWQGPYMTRVMPSHGDLRLDIGIVKDTLVRNPPVANNNNHAGELAIKVMYVQSNEAEALDRRVDGGAVNQTAGKIRWGAADADGFVTVEYTMAVTGC